MTRTRIVAADGTGPPAPRPIYGGALGSVRRGIDSFVGMFAPRTARSMIEARLRSAQMLAYEAARITRLQPPAKTGSADAEILPDLQKLKDKSRAMVRNDAHGAAGIRVAEENVVGKGLVAQSACTPQETGLSPEACEEWRRAIEAEFTRWDLQVADATGHGTFTGDLLRIGCRSLMVDGESISHAITDGSEVRCELIDSDRLESPSLLDTDTIRGGVELDAMGRAIAYHVLDKHPFDVTLTGFADRRSTRIKRTEGQYSLMQHVFRRERAGQTRGVPWLAASLQYSGHLHHYLNSELMAARANSSVAMVVKRAPDTSDGDIHQGTENTAGGTPQWLQTMDAVTIEYLEPGEEMDPFIPNRPGTQFDPFVRRMLRAIWSAPGLAYELITKDFASMNYSSARALLLECRRSFDHTRGLLVHQMCRPWWWNVAFAAIAAGRLQAPKGFFDNPTPFLAVRWVPPAYGWVDPTKEIEASRMAQEANLANPYDEAARAGCDLEEVVRARGRFESFKDQIEQEFGLEKGRLSQVPAAGGGAPPQPAGDENNQNPAKGDEDA